MEYKNIRLSDFANINMGQSPKSEFYNYEGQGLPFLQGNRTFGSLFPTFDTYTTNPTKVAEPNDIIMSVRAPVGDLNIAPTKLCLGRGVCSLRAKNNNQKFLFYLMKHYVKQLINRESGTVFGSVNRDDIANLEISIPEESVQHKIAAVLSSLDTKIELNTAINNNLEQQAMALFKAWFVDFEHCQSEPFKDSEIGKIPSSYKVYHLKDFLPVITGKKNANVSSDKGKYPFFSCSQTIAWTDDYSFDGDAILVAGNGDFNVKFYKGKFEAYQRTYVLIPYEPKYTAWLYYAVKHNLHNITSAARGSVISFITKGNLEDFAFAAPEDLASASIIETFSSINKIIDANIRENYNLEAVRDTLLPKLMSGEIDVSKVDISDPGCLDKSLFNKETE